MTQNMTKQNYELLIGKKFGDREILDIVKKKRSGVFFRYAVCKCKCGRIHEVDLCNLQTDARAQKCRYCGKADKTEPNSQNKLGIRNISFSSAKQKYEVEVKRNGVRKRGYACTLSKAKELKEQFLLEFEKENAANG